MRRSLRILLGMASLAMTRIINASVLLELGEHRLLTDPYFDRRWYQRFNEPIGLTVGQLPKLTAILGCHSVPDHWQPAALAGWEHAPSTPVFVATRSMERNARAAGFERVEVLGWNEERTIAPGLQLEVLPPQTAGGLKVNNYVLTCGSTRVFFGSETLDLEPLRAYRARRPPCDVVFAPIDGASLFGHPLVMNPAQALEAAQILGARVLVPIHYSLVPVPLLLQTPGTLSELRRRAEAHPQLRVVTGATGQRRVVWPAEAAQR